jgi:aspartate aminotransferase
MTGWRIGWVLGPKPLVEAITAFISHSTQCPTSFAQQGAVLALTGPQGFVAELLEEYRRRRDYLHRELSTIQGLTCSKPAGSFYVFPSVKRFLGKAMPTSFDLALRLLEDRHVAVVPGEGFAAPGYLRISFSRSMPELQEGVSRLRGFLEGTAKARAR